MMALHKEEAFSDLLIVLQFLTKKSNKRKLYTNLNLCPNKKQTYTIKAFNGSL